VRLHALALRSDNEKLMKLLLRTWALALCGVVLLGTAIHADPQTTFQQAGFRAVHDLLRDYYAGNGSWRECNRSDCATANGDWGADSATYALYLRWSDTHNPEFAARMAELLNNAPQYGPPCNAARCASWSDTPAWDAVAAMREYDVLRNPHAIADAKAALAYAQGSPALLRGACPSIPYQHPPQDGKAVKTLETTANAIKADLLVYEATHDAAYLKAAQAGYDAARRYFLDAQLPLYTVHLIDDGTNCTQVRGRFFASVNGDMIWNGIVLMRLTGLQHYGEEAVATARAVDDHLSDDRGVFANVQGDNDVSEPLVEAMLRLAKAEHFPFAQAWIVRNAAAALSARGSDGSFSRFFDGPPQSSSSIWETNGGFALEIAAAELEPASSVDAASGWNAGDVSVSVKSLPASIVVDGSGVALVGTMTPLCEHGHVRVLVDGVRTTDRTGLWQNPAMPRGPSVLFAWQWSEPGHHVVTLEPGDTAAAMPNAVSLKSYVTK
jgi:hypothetical protein